MSHHYGQIKIKENKTSLFGVYIMTWKIFQKNTCPRSKFESHHYGHMKIKDNKIFLFGDLYHDFFNCWFSSYIWQQYKK